MRVYSQPVSAGNKVRVERNKKSISSYIIYASEQEKRLMRIPTIQGCL